MKFTGLYHYIRHLAMPSLSILGIIATTLIVAYCAHQLMPHAGLSLLFLTAVLVIAVRHGRTPTLVASILSFLAYNFFFTRPYYTLAVDDEDDVITLVFFIIVALITGHLAARMHQAMEKSDQSLQRISSLYEFSRSLSSDVDKQTVLTSLAEYLGKTLQRTLEIRVLPEPNRNHCKISIDNSHAFSEAAFQTLWQSIEKSSNPTVIDGDTYLCFSYKEDCFGIVALQGSLDQEQTEVARNLIEQASIALERIQLATDLEQARIISETEQLRSALLSSVSHDLRTPLASIIGAATSVIEYGASLNQTDHKDLLASIVSEAQRLDRYIQNLLDMTRIEQGSLTLMRDWVDVHDIIASAIERMKAVLQPFTVDIHIADEAPLLWVHGVLIEQALVNLLDNAVQFSPPHGVITINVAFNDTDIVVNLCDQGPGIAESEREKIFDMFYSARQGDRRKKTSTGLGLSICRGMIAAHHGTVSAHPGINGKGTCMRITLPHTEPK